MPRLVAGTGITVLAPGRVGKWGWLALTAMIYSPDKRPHGLVALALVAALPLAAGRLSATSGSDWQPTAAARQSAATSIVAQVAGDKVRISGQVAAGYDFQLQQSTNLAHWVDSGELQHGGSTGSAIDVVVPAAAAAATFYRVAVSEGQGAADETPWNRAALVAATPAVEDTTAYAVSGLRSIFYQALDWNGQPTRVYAYLGLPAGTPPAAGWPAVVLVHGGGGTAFHAWVKRWTSRGFAALAMDLEGRLPDLTVAFADRPTFEGSGPVRVGVWGDADLPPADQWFYHAVAQTMLGYNVLAAQPHVDASNIGIMGVSWGGIITCVVAGIDARFRFAIPVYGCGFLVGTDAQMGRALAAHPPARLARILEWWEPTRYLPNVRMPMLFVNSPNDSHFPINAWQQSIDAVPGPVWQSAQIGLTHGHTPPQLLEEPYAFARAVVDGQTDALPRLQPAAGGAVNITAEFQRPPPPLAAVRLAATTGTGLYINRAWSRSNASIDGSLLAASLPTGASGWFFETVTASQLLFTAPYREP
jgi:dienelactone hydrolase